MDESVYHNYLDKEVQWTSLSKCWESEDHSLQDAAVVLNKDMWRISINWVGKADNFNSPILHPPEYHNGFAELTILSPEES